MDGRPRRNPARLGLSLIATLAALTSCGRSPEGPAPAAPAAVLAAAGRRLSRDHSAAELTRIAADGSAVLNLLTPSERDALARGGLSFRVDRPAVVSVAAPRNSLPFWLGERGFRPSPRRLAVAGDAWVVYERTVEPGGVGLGVNALDRRAPAHYVVFLTDPRGGPVTPSDVQGDGWDLAKAAPGVGLAAGVDLPATTLDPSLQGATLLRPAHDRRHGTALARGRVWKTHVVSSPKPDQVTVSFGADAATELVWAWRTSPDVSPTVLRLAPVTPGIELPPGGPAAGMREVRGESTLVETPPVINDPAMRRHAVKVDGLEPATAYAYSVGDGTAGGMSPWSVVRTGPRRGEAVHLMYLGDPQCGLEKWGELLATARRRHPEVQSLLIAGDLVDRGNERTNWDHFFLRAAGVFDRVPVMPAAGNHDYLDAGPRLYRAFFRLPANGPEGVPPGLVYAYEHGDVFLAVLDSTAAVSSPAEAARQARWLDARLASTSCRWKLVMFHHPVYASHPTREYPSLAEVWAPVFDRHSVDLVLQGHDHAYLRTYPMRGGRRAGAGPVYVVAVSGDKYSEQAPREYAEVAFPDVSTYQTIDVDPAAGRLVYRAFDLSGAERDRLVIERPEAAARVAVRGR